MTVATPRGRAVLSLGRIYADLVFNGIDTMPMLGREVFANDFAVTPGGGALITAAHVAALGRSAVLLARFGTDAISAAISDEIENLGIDLQFLDRSPSAGPQLTVAIVKDSERAFLSRRAGHAAPATFEAALAWGEAAHLHIAEYATLHEMRDAVTSAKRHGLTVSLDPSWDAELIKDPMFFEVASGVDVFMPNLEEAEALTHQSDASVALDILARHFPIVALKCGSEGAMLAANGTVTSLPGQKVTVVDTTGAGDAFNAGFLHAWLDGNTPEQSLAAAITTGSRSVQARGGTGSIQQAAAH